MSKIYYSEYPEKRSNKWLKTRYGIDIEQYKKVLENQNYLCAICGCSENDTKHKRMSVDHCHSSGKIRGLLCRKCNAMLGLVNDNVDTLLKAIDYLESGNLGFGNGKTRKKIS